MAVVTASLTLTVSLWSPAGEVNSTPAAPSILAFTDTDPWVDTQDQEALLAFIEAAEVASPADMDWSGSHAQCEAGNSSNELRSQAIDRVNFYRALAGVPALVTEEPVFSAKAQHGALTMSAEGVLSHTPDDSYACISEFGIEAAANSNLYLGRSGAAAIDGYIEDPGVGNVDVGHRLTILHPPTRKMGVGHSAETATALESNVLWVFDDNVFEPWDDIREEEGFVAWPPRGFITEDLVYPRWSFSLNAADFSEAVVTMTDPQGQSVELDVVARQSQQAQVPPPVIVWEPELSERNSEAIYNVVIDNVGTDQGPARFSYDVTIIG